MLGDRGIGALEKDRYELKSILHHLCGLAV